MKISRKAFFKCSLKTEAKRSMGHSHKPTESVMRISLPWDYRSAVLSTGVFRGVVPILVILGGKEQIPPGRLRWYLRLTGLWPRCERGHWNVKAVGLSCLLGNLILNGTTCGMSSLGLQSSQCPRTYKDL